MKRSFFSNARRLTVSLGSGARCMEMSAHSYGMSESSLWGMSVLLPSALENCTRRLEKSGCSPRK